jgi:hypothetical protein
MPENGGIIRMSRHQENLHQQGRHSIATARHAPSIARSQLPSNQKRRTVTAEIHNSRKTQQQRHKQQQGHKQRNSRDTSDIRETENSGTKRNERRIYIRIIDHNSAVPSTARLFATAGMAATKGTPANEKLVISICGVQYPKFNILPANQLVISILYGSTNV